MHLKRRSKVRTICEVLDFFKVASGCAGAPEEQYELMRYFTLYFVRRLKTDEIKEDGVNDVRENCDSALQNLAEYPELQHKMAKFAAEIEFQYFFQKSEAGPKEEEGSLRSSAVQRIKDCMELVVRSKEGNVQENWLYFGKLFITMGDIKEARRVFTRGINYCTSDKSEIIAEWLKMEEIRGTAQSILAAQTKIQQKGEQIQTSFQEEKKEEPHNNKRRQLEAKKRRFVPQAPNVQKQKHSLYFKNLPEQLTEEGLSDIINTILQEAEKDKYQVRIVRNIEGVSKGFAYVDFEEKQTADKALTLHHMEIMGNQCSVAVSKPPSKGENDHRTVFVNNLSFQTTDAELETLFAEYGEITEVRLIKDERGKPKGYGYVEFSSEEEAETAISKMDKQRISGRVLSVMKANSVRKEKQESDRTVHISNIPYEAAEMQIETQFAKFGIIKKLYLPRTEEGTIRGFAFIEYDSEEAAKKAVRTKTITIMGRGVLIRKSTRKITAPVGSAKNDEFLPPLPVKKKKVDMSSVGGGEMKGKSAAKKGEKSNQDFASSLFSK